MGWHGQLEWGQKYQFFECFSGKARVSKRMQLRSSTVADRTVADQITFGALPRSKYGYRVANFDRSYSERCMDFMKPSGMALLGRTMSLVAGVGEVPICMSDT